MPFYLRSHVHAAVLGDDVVILDTRNDAYSCVPGGAADIVEDEGPAMRARGRLAAALEAQGLVAPVPSPRRRPPPLPTRTVIHDDPERIRLRDLIDGAAVVWDLRAADRGEGVTPYLEVQPEGPSGPVDPAAVEAAARRFWRLATWLPIEGVCLTRSAMLAAFLRRGGLRADWVFGVRLWPFAAHCWLQQDDVCLNDDVERLVAFTPILVR